MSEPPESVPLEHEGRKSTFSKITADSRRFSNHTADFSKVRESFFGSPSSFYSKVTADGTADTDVEECTYSTPETGILWESITQNENLLFRVKRIGREWNGEVRRVANALRLHFLFQTPLIMRTPESSFLFQEFIGMCLEQVHWIKLATLMLEVPYQPEMALEREEKEGDYEAMQIALMKETLWRSYSDFGEFSLCPLFSELTRELCLDLADHCHNTHQEISKLEKKSTDSSSTSL